MREFLIVAGIHCLAVMSPGPDFAMVMRNSLVYSRRTGILAAAGLALGILLHVSYSLIGIGLLISRSVTLFNTIKYVGAAYLIFIGIKSLLAKKTAQQKPDDEFEQDFKEVPAKDDLSVLQAIRMGFLTNALNPKATLFFLALFTQVISPQTQPVMKMLYGFEMSVATFIWFGLVALLLTHHVVNRLFGHVKQYIERVFGVILVGLGLKVALGGHK